MVASADAAAAVPATNGALTSIDHGNGSEVTVKVWWQDTTSPFWVTPAWIRTWLPAPLLERAGDEELPVGHVERCVELSDHR